MAFDAHVLAWDCARAATIAPYGDDAAVALMSAEIVRCGGSVMQTHKLAANDLDHIAALLEHFAPEHGAHVLDAGCGVGIVALLMRHLRPDLRFSLLNISAAQLAMCPEGMPRLHASFHDIPAEADTFDAVMFNYCLGHGLLDRCVSEAGRVLRPGGVLFIYCLTSDVPDYVIPRVGFKPHPRAEVEAAAARHGFVASNIVENPPSSTADYSTLFGAEALARLGLDRTWPIIYRFNLSNRKD